MLDSLKTLSDAVFRVREISSGRSDLLIWQGASGRETLSAPDLFSGIHGLLLVFEGWGLQPGDSVAIFSENRPEWIVADFAIQVFGLVTVPIPPEANSEQAGFILRNSQSRAVFYGDVAQRDALLAAGAATHPPRRVAFDASIAAPGDFFLTQLLGEQAARRASVPMERFRGRGAPDDPAAYFYSGKQGKLWSHEQILAGVARRAEVLRSDREDLLFSPVSLSSVEARIFDLAAFLQGARICYSGGESGGLALAVIAGKPTILLSEALLLHQFAEVIHRENAARTKLTRRFAQGALRKNLGLEQTQRILCRRDESEPGTKEALESIGVAFEEYDPEIEPENAFEEAPEHGKLGAQEESG